MNREDLLNKLEEIHTEYNRRLHDAQAKEDCIFISGLCGATARIIKLVKDDEDVQPEHSCIKSVYLCGKKPHWNVGDTLAFYEFYSNREGECVLGKVIKVELDEEECDWFYTFEDGSIYDEESLLENQTYKLKD